MVTAPEAAALLAIASSFDNRTQNSAATRAWAEALSDIDFDDAQTAIVRHYAATREWVMPSDIRHGVHVIQADRVANGPNLAEVELPTYLEEMDDGPEFDAAYLAWVKRQAELARKGLPLEVGPERVPGQRQLVS
jgi:hypothetical protein